MQHLFAPRIPKEISDSEYPQRDNLRWSIRESSANGSTDRYFIRRIFYFVPLWREIMVHERSSISHLIFPNRMFHRNRKNSDSGFAGEKLTRRDSNSRKNLKILNLWCKRVSGSVGKRSRKKIIWVKLPVRGKLCNFKPVTEGNSDGT